METLHNKFNWSLPLYMNTTLNYWQCFLCPFLGLKIGRGADPGFIAASSVKQVKGNLQVGATKSQQEVILASPQTKKFDNSGALRRVVLYFFTF